MPNQCGRLRRCVRISTLLALSAWASLGWQAFSLADEDGPAFLADPLRFKTLVNPDCSHCVDEARRRANDLQSDDRVLCWIRGKYDGGAIPYRFFLAPYRVISDTYGVFVYDPEAGFARGFEPSLEFTFHGWRNGVLVIAHQDGTLFSALSGRAFAGPREGEILTPVPTLTTEWGSWNGSYPDTVAYRMFEKYQPISLPITDDKRSVGTRGAADERLPEIEEVLGVEVAGVARAYPLRLLEQSGGVIHDRIGEQELAVLWQASTRTAAAYATEIDGSNPPRQVMLKADDAGDSDGAWLDAASNSRWDIAGRAIDGDLKGQVLRWLPSVQCRWFAWAAEYPQTSIFEVEQAPDAPLRQSRLSPKGPRNAVLASPIDVTSEQADRWSAEGIDSIIMVLDEGDAAEIHRVAAAAVDQAGLSRYYWIEVARNPRLADAHPDWMAALGSHEDWLARFPGQAAPGEGEVAKAWPWVPIGYAAAFAAHLERVRGLVASVPNGYRGLLLNDLQGGPAACGCGNLQCRWALDYGVPSTTKRHPGQSAAGDFLAAVSALLGDKELIPVWTTECEDADLPNQHQTAGRASTCKCGSVPCALGRCPQEFAHQWIALKTSHHGPLGILLTHREFGRSDEQGRSAAQWLTDAIASVDLASEQRGQPAVQPDRMWLVLQAYDVSPEEIALVRRAAESLQPGAVILATSRIDATYEPRLVKLGR